MVCITYVAPGGVESRVNVRQGDSLMLGAVMNNVRGVDGECGGCLSCATCHVYIDPEWIDRLAAADPMEAEMLESVSAERRPTSRLSCQIQVTPDMEGLRVELPETQS